MNRQNPKPLLSESLQSDPRLLKAKQALLDIVSEYQEKLTEPKPADPGRLVQYQELLTSLNKLRGAPTFYPYLGSGFGHGALVELLDGSVKYDCITGVGVHYLGHNHPLFMEAAISAALENTLMQGHLQQNSVTIDVSEILCTTSNMPHCFLTTSGAMANENALKIAFQARLPASRLLAFAGNFSGRTCVLSQITDKPSFRQGLPLNIAVDYVPFLNPDAPEESLKKALNVLRDHLTRYPNQHALFICELIQGEGGCYAGSHAFFEPLFALCRKAGVLILADEVQTFGRTSKLFAFQHFGLEDYVDIVTVGKLLQVCATLFKDSIAPKPGLLSQTFISSSSALYAAKGILHELLHGDYLGELGKNMRIGDFFRKGLQTLAEKQPEWLHGPFGMGAMIAFTPFEGQPKQVEEVLHTLFKNGLIAFSAGGKEMRVRLLLPIGACDEALCTKLLDIIATTLSECHAAQQRKAL